jgi:hypothetical protein
MLIQKLCRGRIFKATTFVFAVGLSAWAIAAATAGSRNGRANLKFEERGKIHKCLFPIIDSQADSECVAEIAAYASAIVYLRAAQECADEAFEDWMECEYGSGEYAGGEYGLEAYPGTGEPTLAKERLPIHSIVEK